MIYRNIYDLTCIIKGIKSCPVSRSGLKKSFFLLFVQIYLPYVYLLLRDTVQDTRMKKRMLRSLSCNSRVVYPSSILLLFLQTLVAVDRLLQTHIGLHVMLSQKVRVQNQ